MALAAADVAQWGKFTTPSGGDLALLERVLAAVTKHVEDHYVVETPLSVDQEQAVLMQSYRLWARRETPQGIAAFADIAALRIQALDADVAMLLDRQWNFA